MSMTITDPTTGELVEVFARECGDYVDMIVRADTHGYWRNVAEDWGLIDADENPMLGVTIDPIGPVETTPAVFDALGAVVTPAITDNRHHLNLRVATDFNWRPFASKWTQDGSATVSNASENGKRFYRVTLIDPDTISTPSRVFL